MSNLHTVIFSCTQVIKQEAETVSSNGVTLLGRDCTCLKEMFLFSSVTLVKDLYLASGNRRGQL